MASSDLELTEVEQRSRLRVRNIHRLIDRGHRLLSRVFRSTSRRSTTILARLGGRHTRSALRPTCTGDLRVDWVDYAHYSPASSVGARTDYCPGTSTITTSRNPQKPGTKQAQQEVRVRS
jgi:hypothetical protein